jgi:hypothetical protein
MEITNTVESATQPPTARRRHRVFWTIYLALQILFLVWIIVGVASQANTGAEAHTEAVNYCQSSWSGLYPSYGNCVTDYGNLLNAASDAGKGIGAGLIIGLWVAADVIVGGSYIVYRLATRRR